MISEIKPQILPIEEELKNIYHEARIIALASHNQLKTGHFLLAMFSSTNSARLILEAHGIHQDSLIQFIGSHTTEPCDAVRQIREQTEQTALRFSARKANSLHLLNSLLNNKHTIAFEALNQMANAITKLRTEILANLSGAPAKALRQALRSSNTSREITIENLKTDQYIPSQDKIWPPSTLDKTTKKNHIPILKPIRPKN